MAIYTPDTVDVSVFLESAPSTQQSFEFPLVAIPHNLTTNTIDTFPSIDSVTAAGAAINSPVYMFASGLFGGIAAPASMKVARANVTTITLSVNSIPAEASEISLNANVNGVASVISYTIAGGDDENAAAAALEALLTAAYPTADAQNPTFGVAGSVITATIPVGGYGASFGWASFNASTLVPHVSILDNTTDQPVTTLQNALAQDDDVAFLMAETHDSTDVAAIATFAQSSGRYQYKTSTNDVNSADSGNTSNIAYSLNLLAQNKVELMLSAVADTHFPEAAVIGGQAGISPANIQTANLLSLPNIPTDNWTEQQRATLAARNTNFYVEERGVGTYREGWSMSGQFGDVIRFSLWIKETTEQSLFDLLRSRVNQGRPVPYSSAGARIMENTVNNNVVRVGINGGTIATGFDTNAQGQTIDLNPIIRFGNRSDQTDADIGNRIWRNGLVEVVYLGAVHHAKINVYVVNNRQPQ